MTKYLNLWLSLSRRLDHKLLFGPPCRNRENIDKESHRSIISCIKEKYKKFDSLRNIEHRYVENT